MQITRLIAALAVAGSLVAADTTPGTTATSTDNGSSTTTGAASDGKSGATVGAGAANSASGAAQDAGGKAGTETGAGRGNDVGAGAAKAGGATTALKLDSLPPDVKSAVTREAAAQEISAIRQTTRDGKPAYEVDLDRGGRHELVTFDQQGRRLAGGNAAGDATHQ